MKTATIGLLLITSLTTTVSLGQVVLTNYQAEKGVQYLEERKHLIVQDSLKDSIIKDGKVALEECMKSSEDFKSSADSWQGSAEAWQSAYKVSAKRADDNYNLYTTEKRKNRWLVPIAMASAVLGFFAGVN